MKGCDESRLIRSKKPLSGLLWPKQAKSVFFGKKAAHKTSSAAGNCLRAVQIGRSPGRLLVAGESEILRQRDKAAGDAVSKFQFTQSHKLCSGRLMIMRGPLPRQKPLQCRGDPLVEGKGVSRPFFVRLAIIYFQ